jgi:hypothetical protein
MWILIFIIFLMFSKVPLTNFQFLLLLCFIEVKTGFFVGDFYWSIIFISYVLIQRAWYSALKGGRFVWH